ncbi:PepSY-associated TM helix domain-containing protein [Shewanella sp.]|uniref:PepSY-associated TM helix domain-containing protein n=1 Tax=Shewanella sp. TaxID=50422 RepID=UPI003A855F8D
MKVRSDVLRVYQSIHIWTGIIAGIVLFIGFYAGSLTMFKGAIDAWSMPPSVTLPQVSTDRLDELVSQVLARDDKAKNGFSLHLNDHHQSPMTWYQQGSERELNMSNQLWHASLDELGQLVTQLSTPSELAELIDQLHRTAGIAGEVGHDQAGVYVLGVAAVLYFLALISGVIFLLPTLTKSFFALRKDKGESRFWLDAHNLVGITSLPFHLVISLTVIVFAFHDQLYDGLKHAVYGEKPLFAQPAPDRTPYTLADLPKISTVLAKVQDLAPEYQVHEMTFMSLNNPRATLRLGLYNPKGFMRGPVTDYLYLHPYSLKVSNSTIDQSDKGIWARTVAVFFGLHFGSYGGDLGRWVYFFLGLSGALLFYSGNLLWLEKRRKKQTRACRLMASATVGICLGSVAALAVSMLLGKWLYAHVSNINHIYLWLYYVVFAALVAYAFWRGAARAALLILPLCALATLAMPITSLIGLLVPSLGLWAPDSAVTLGVDLVALGFSGLFFYGYRLTRHRVLNGPQDSVWAIPSKETVVEETRLKTV